MLQKEGLYHIETKELSIAGSTVDSVEIAGTRRCSMGMRRARIVAADRR